MLSSLKLKESMTKLSVNLNKVALLRNQRDVGYPGVVEHAKYVLEAGAHGLTVHPRPDERHVRKSDIPELAEFLASWPDKKIEFNIEGYPSEEFIKLCLDNKCDQVTLVPDAPSQKTSDHGWDVMNNQTLLKDAVSRLQAKGRRVSIFVDPDPKIIEAVKAIGADRIELYTAPYDTGEVDLETYARTAELAKAAKIGVNAGHDLHLDNLSRFIENVSICDEVSIGHAVIADALKMGWNATVQAYLTAIEYGQKRAKNNKAA